jgi:hypothetical protein
MRFGKKAAAVAAAGTISLTFAALQLAPTASAAPAPAERSVTVNVPAVSQTPTRSRAHYFRGELLEISAHGMAGYGAESQAGCVGAPTTTPDGNRSLSGAPCSQKIDPSAVLPTAPIGSLIASIGVPGQPGSSGWFYVGNYLRLRNWRDSGEIYLLYNDVPGEYGNNLGSYNALLKLRL